MEAVPSERQFVNEEGPRLQAERLTLYSQRQHREKTIYVETFEYQHVLFLPVYLYGYITELVKVNLESEQVSCKCTFYVTMLTDIQPEHVQLLMSESYFRLPPEDREAFLAKEGKILTDYIRNNLIIECGSLVIDIVNEERIFQKYSEEGSDYDSSEEEEEIPDDFYYSEVNTGVSSQHTVTYRISGTFSCEFQLSSVFFPYHTIASALRIRVREQFYDSLIIRYSMFQFEEQISDLYQQFGFKIIDNNFRTFGIYNFNCSEATYGLEAIKEKFQMVEYLGCRDTFQETYQVTKQFQFKFQVYSYNVPFILRNIVPQLLLCFVSLISYFTDPDIFANVILISVSLIQLLSSYRSSKYDSSEFNLYQLNILAIVLINFLLQIIGTVNLYGDRAEESEINTRNAFFWISVGIGVFILVSNLLVFTYYGCQTKKYSKYKSSRDYTHLWMYHEEIIGNLVDKLTALEEQHSN